MGKKSKGTGLPQDYECLDRLGLGTRDEVWDVEDVVSGARLALKISTQPDPSHRLQREFAILRRIDIVGIVKAESFGEHEGREYFTMKLVKGRSITGFFESRRSRQGFIELFLDVFQRSAVILSNLHRQGIVHIDIKPNNLLVRKEEEPLLLDFGFAEDYMLGPTAEPSGTTLDYAAPELFTGGYVTPAADIYSLGAIAYEILKGKVPWADIPVRELISSKLRTPPGLGKLDVKIPSGLEDLILRMMNPEPSLRPSAEEVMAEMSWLGKGEKVDVSPPRMAPRLVFGGRDEELEELERLAFVERRVVFLEGESGIGKTRLLRELRFRALRENQNILYIEGRGAHLSLVDYLFSLLHLESQNIKPDKDRPPDKWSRYERVYQGIDKGGFDALFIDAPVDLTEDEKGLLGYLSRGFDMKLGVIVSQASYDIYPEGLRMELGPLDKAKITQLITRTFGELEKSRRLADTLLSVAKGNPRRMNELLDVLYKEAWFCWDRGWVYEPGKDEKGIAEKLEGWLGDSISSLDKDARMVLDMLAIAQGPLPREVIEKITGENTPLILQELVNKDYIRTLLYLNLPHLEFANDLVKPYLQNKLTAITKKSLAKKLAEELEKINAGLWGEKTETWNLNHLAQVAKFFFEAGVSTKAPKYLLVAGSRMFEETGNFKNAEKFLQDTLKCEPEKGIKRHAFWRLGEMASSELHPKEAEAFYEKAIPLYEGNIDTQVSILVNIGTAYQRVRDLDRADYFFEKGERYIADLSDDQKSKLLLARGWNAYHRGKLDEAQGYFEKALAITASEEGEEQANHALACTLAFKGDLSNALKYAKKALEIDESGGYNPSACIVILRIANILRGLGRFEELDKYLNKATLMSEGITDPIIICQVLDTKAYFLSLAGRYRQALSRTRRALEMLVKIDNKFKIGALWAREAEILTELGEWKEAQNIYIRLWRNFHGTVSISSFVVHILYQWGILNILKGDLFPANCLLKKGIKIAEARDYKLMSTWLVLGCCKISIASGDLVKARELLRECRNYLEIQKDEVVEVEILMCEAEILLIEDKKSHALKTASRMVSDLEKYGSGLKYLQGAALRIFGKALITSGRCEEGLTKLKESLEISKSREQPYEQGLNLFEIANALFEHKGYSEEAVAALEEAQTIFERLGAAHQLEKIKKLRAEHLKDMKDRAGLSLRYLEGIRGVNDLINEHLGEDDFMSKLLVFTIELTGAGRGMVFLAEQGKLLQVASQTIDSMTAQDACQLSRTITAKILKEQRPIYTSDAFLDERFKKSESILLNDIHSFICVPLKSGDRLFGTIYLDSKKTGLFTTSNLIYFENLANLLAASIERTAEYKKLETELAVKQGRRDFEKAGIVLGNSTLAKKLHLQLEHLARSNTNILIEGETGSGKGVFARMIHERSFRREHEFCIINCGILPENIFESELFGTRKGAYTGATHDRIGLLEAADLSTVFFDEITNTSPLMQAKLLEVIEEKVIRRMGDTKPRKVDLRFIFATNRNLEEEVKAGRFREDLYYRLSAFTLKLPPLRERTDDIPEFVKLFSKHFSREFDKEVTGIEDDALRVLLRYYWPGNIRELRNVIERSVMLCPGRRITKDNLEQHFKPAVTQSPDTFQESLRAEEKRKQFIDSKPAATSQPRKPRSLKLDEAKVDLERELIRRALAEHKTLEEAAKALGIDRRSLWRKKKALGL